MKQPKANLDVIFERLVAKNEQLDREQELILKELGAISANSQQKRGATQAHNNQRQMNEIAAELEKIEAADASASWEQFSRPSIVEIVGRHRGRMLRA